MAAKLLGHAARAMGRYLIRTASPTATWGEVVDAWIEATDWDTLAPETHRCYLYRCSVLTDLMGRDQILSDIDTQFVDKMIVTLGKKYSSATRHQTMRIFCQIVTWATKRGYCRDISDHLRLPRHNSTYRQIGPDDYFTLAELEMIIASAMTWGDEYIAAVFAVAGYTGLRRGEIAGLEWGDIDMDKRLIFVQRQGDTERKPKGGKTRHVPLDRALTPHLLRWRARSRWSGERDPVFARREDGRHYSSQVFRFDRFLKRACRRVGIRRPRINHHMMRHSFASNWLIRGGNDWLLASAMGHKDTKQIYGRYAHFRRNNLVSEVDRLSGVS